jgi:hypothetical protein
MPDPGCAGLPGALTTLGTIVEGAGIKWVADRRADAVKEEEDAYKEVGLPGSNIQAYGFLRASQKKRFGWRGFLAKGVYAQEARQKNRTWRKSVLPERLCRPLAHLWAESRLVAEGVFAAASLRGWVLNAVGVRHREALARKV